MFAFYSWPSLQFHCLLVRIDINTFAPLGECTHSKATELNGREFCMALTPFFFA